MTTIKTTWKPVTISGFTGILMGAGAMHFHQKGDAITAEQSDNAEVEGKSLDDLSFKEAFDTARAEIGPGGVFRWHGNLYNTYTADEWQAMNDEQKELLADDVSPEISPEDIDTHEIAANEEAGYNANGEETDGMISPTENAGTAETTLANDATVQSDDEDVRIVGYGEVELQNGRNVTVQEIDVNGQRVAVIDLDQDGVADVAMSDLNHNRLMDEGEVIDLHTGEAVSFTNDDVAVNDIPVDTLGI